MTENKPVIMAPTNGLLNKSKELQKEILMEKLRSKTSQFKNLSETSKAVRMALLDKRWAVDSADRMTLQKCLDSLQHCIKVSSLQSLIERLECLSRQLGLKFVVGTSGVNIFISSDMFYLEILVEFSGAVKDVKIHHEGRIEQQSCEELVSCITRGDFADFTAQLEGLIAVYQLNAEKKVKCKAFSALQSLEEDLCTLRQLQSFIKDPWAQVHKSPIGFLQKRRGGHAMRLTYFVSPYELLDRDKGLQPLTTELLTLGKPAAASGLASLVAPSHTPIGHSATVLLEGSTANKLQLSPIISGGQRTGKGNGPVYAQLVPQNSAMLPACFTLKLSQPMPLCSGLAKLIHATTEVEVAGDWANAKPMLGLVAQEAYNKLNPGKNIELNLSKGLFVNLPEQTQCYFVMERRGLEGCVVGSVPFTHPSHVAPLLACLRQQALFNALIASCVRTQSKHVDIENAVIFEVSALSWQHISVALEHPLDESLATLELDLAEPAAPRARLHALHSPHAAQRDQLDDYISRVLQKSHSIPVTLRSLVKIWEREAATKQMNGSYSALESNFSCGLGGMEGGDVKPPSNMHGRALYPSSGHAHQPHQHHQHHQNHQQHPTSSYLSEQQHHLSMMCQDSTNNETKPQTSEDRKSKKRKSDTDIWSSTQKKGKPGLSEMADSESESDNSDAYVNEDENTMNSNSTNDDIEGRESSVSQNEFTSDLELSAMDTTDALGGQDNRTSSDVDNSNDGDVEDMIRNSFQKSDHKRQKLKSKDSESRSNRSTSSLLLDLTEGKSYMPSSVSITPIGSNSSNSSNSGSNISSMLCLDRRPGIEIIPITSAAPAALPSSITITPITSSQLKSLDDRNRSEKKSSRSGEERSKEKKKKRRRDDSMGPPEKVPPKQDPLTKPVSVSIKPTDGSPMRPTSPNSLLRKFSPSPTHGRSVSITKSPSPSTVKGMGKPSGTSSHQSSPRHSPVQNSPKHLPGYSSPKNHSVSSPKHSSSGSGKPSMSTLKSATSGSPSGKSGTTGYDLTKKMSKDTYGSSSLTSRDKEKKHSSLSFSSSGRSSPKLKNPMKLKQLEITPISCDSPITEPLISPPNVEVNKSNAPSQARNRKGSLSAVIDKLKSAQHCGTDTAELAGAKSSSSNSANKFSDSKNSSPGNTKVSESKNQEYMVKPSLDGMKITINKTRTKESSNSSSKLNYSSSSSSKSSPQLTPPSQGSPKTHTGLKPGVISGPASKKTQVLQSSKSSSTATSSTPPKANLSPSESGNNSNVPKVPYSKTSTNTGINLSKSSSKSSSGSPKSSNTDQLAKIIKDREREKARTKLMSNSEKSIFSSKSERHSSPSSSRDEVDSDRFKTSKDANFLVEGLMKPLDTSKFQIPKLKNQSTPDKNSPVSQYDSRSMVNDFSRAMDQNKYPFSHFDNPNARGSDMQKSTYTLNVPKPLLNMGGISPKTTTPNKGDQSDRPLEFTKAMADSLSKGESPQRSKDDPKDFSGSYPIMPLDFKTDMVKGFPAPKGSSEDRKGADSCMKPPASGAVARSGATTPQEAAEMLLDFSSSSGSKVSGMVAVRSVYPASPALAMQLAKSPAASPLVVPSPHSNSPCITDDELMDEALVGPGK
ncbi:mediator of RNA polymerase II transcription subunit 1 [Galleria mellonella]|uniref:Mediator of RNA polymerase II transcription subunit 1 n=1 Tax=Galleria mellonella TaxID=7137 RepID=A0ABM3M857_GALME|nr:mediator of RNA polymerase II transcription subunit 1 [Galleria mellonella]